MARMKQDKDTLPLYGSVTGITLPDGQAHIARGVALRPGLFDTFSTPMMGFAEPPSGGHTPRLGLPWMAPITRFRRARSSPLTTFRPSEA